MEKREKYELMQKISRELEDLKNSQTAIIKKMGQIEAHNINLSDSELEKDLNAIYENVAKNLEAVEALNDSYSEKVEKFSKDNKLDIENEETPT